MEARMAQRKIVVAQLWIGIGRGLGDTQISDEGVEQVYVEYGGKLEDLVNRWDEDDVRDEAIQRAEEIGQDLAGKATGAKTPAVPEVTKTNAEDENVAMPCLC
jgi:hypothetical protein